MTLHAPRIKLKDHLAWDRGAHRRRERDRDYTLRLRRDPRGRLRGGVEGGLAEALAGGGFIPPGAGARTSSGGGALMTRAGCTFAGRVGAGPAGPGGPVGAVALAIPINVAGDNMRVPYKLKGKQPVNAAVRPVLFAACRASFWLPARNPFQPPPRCPDQAHPGRRSGRRP